MVNNILSICFFCMQTGHEDKPALLDTTGKTLVGIVRGE